VRKTETKEVSWETGRLVNIRSLGQFLVGLTLFFFLFLIYMVTNIERKVRFRHT
jgi:hypothetical protein